jgi:hypothetical protein
LYKLLERDEIRNIYIAIKVSPLFIHTQDKALCITACSIIKDKLMHMIHFSFQFVMVSAFSLVIIIWDKTIWRTLHFSAIFDIQTKLLMRSLSVVMFCLYVYMQRLQRTKNLTQRTLQKQPWKFVMLGLMQSSLHLKFVEKTLYWRKLKPLM